MEENIDEFDAFIITHFVMFVQWRSEVLHTCHGVRILMLLLNRNHEEPMGNSSICRSLNEQDNKKKKSWQIIYRLT